MVVEAQEPASGLKSMVIYGARDSMHFDLINEIVYLYDSAYVKYEGMTINAKYIRIDFRNNIITAQGDTDLTSHYLSKASFSDEGQQFEANKLDYNYVTQKGRISEVTTKVGDGYIITDVLKKDSTNTIFLSKGQYTTCDLEHPHYSIRANKMKVIPDDKIVTGPAYLEIADVPTPLAVPFGYFPNKKGRSSGILIPAYGESPSWGFFLRDGGYYWGVGDKLDFALRGDIYSKGSWGIKLFTNYRVRYKYGGQLSAKFARNYNGDRELPTSTIVNGYAFKWSHVQDAKFNPSVRFNANVNISSSSYNQYNSNIANDYLSNTFQSNVQWSKTWKFGSFATNLTHSQNTLTHNVDVGFPNAAFTVNRFYPFRNPERVGKAKWWDKIGMSYTTEFKNSLSITDSILKVQNFGDAEYIRDTISPRLRTGIRQQIPIATSFNVLKYYTLTPAITMNSITQFKTIQKTWDAVNETVVTDTVNGTRMSFDFVASLTLSTKFYGFYTLNRTKFSTVRHVITPGLSLNYMPDFTDPRYGFFKEVQANSAGAVHEYSIFEGGIYGSSPAGKLGSLGLSLMNSWEGKLRPKADDSSDVTERRMLIDALNFGMSYNFLAENLQWSPMTVGLRMKLFRLVDLNAGMTADPYRMNELTGQRIDRFEWRTGKRLARLTSASIALGTSLRPGGFTSSPERNSPRGTQAEIDMVNANPNAYVDFNVPWSLNVQYNLVWSKYGLTSNINQTMRVAGDANVTPKWKVGFDSNYDFTQKQFAYTSLNVYRDLHCWELQFNWIPFGFRQSYNITINVKSAVLQDMKLTRKRDWYDFNQNF
ncbi:MAG TPA: putative LPS assembly protein LptD [Bacteroidia bacterium]|nr:putative LPS assembly protein LptD [Bacteroidia bacterium]